MLASHFIVPVEEKTVYPTKETFTQSHYPAVLASLILVEILTDALLVRLPHCTLYTCHSFELFNSALRLTNFLNGRNNTVGIMM